MKKTMTPAQVLMHLTVPAAPRTTAVQAVAVAGTPSRAEKVVTTQSLMQTMIRSQAYLAVAVPAAVSRLPVVVCLALKVLVHRQLAVAVLAIFLVVAEILAV